MSKFFKEFPRVDYYFGDLTVPVNVQNLNVYIDVIDQFKDAGTFYEKYTILENERPDTLSYKLYRTSNYGWTFFLLNDELRESGWPLNNTQIYNLAKKYYPHTTLTTEKDMTKILTVGSKVVDKLTGATGTILRKRYDYGQIIVELDASSPSTVFSEQKGKQLENVDDPTEALEIYSQVEQYNSVHNWKDNIEGGDWMYDLRDSGYDSWLLTADNWTPLSTITGLGGQVIPQTYAERLKERNDLLREIKVLTPTVVSQVVGEYKRLLRRS